MLDPHYPEADIVDIRKASPLLLVAIAQDAKSIFEKTPGLLEEFKVALPLFGTDFFKSMTEV